MCGNDMLPKNFSRRICDKQLRTAFPHRLGMLGCGADFSKKPSSTEATQTALSAIISPCAGATDRRGERRLLKRTSIAFRGNKTGVRVTTLRLLIFSPNPPESQDSPVNCRKFAGD
jgi:hypothetical protein